jgi:hypothetical protein
MPFRYIKTTSTAVATKSVLFNGSNQYLKLPSNSSAWTLNGNFTIECWFNTSTTNQNGIFTMNWNGDWNAVYGNGFSLSSNVVVTPQGNTTWTSPSINVWHHIAVVRSGTTLTTYVDGVSVGSQTNSNQFGNASTTPGVGLFDTQGGVRAPFLGYISNLRILKGTALYTASFTVPTAPLTAIANTSLLTCNADTIVDSSTNNFTITNNGGATVSSVVPFNAVGFGYKFKNVSNPTSGLAGTQKAIFGYGSTGAVTAITNLVSNTGVVANDTTGVGTARTGLVASGYGTDKAIFGYGSTGTVTAITNLVSNTGVVANDTTGVGTARLVLAATGYSTDKAIFGYGYNSSFVGVSITNLVSNTGVVATDTTGVGTARSNLAAARYGTDKAIFGYGYTGTSVSMTNLVSNTGVVATDTTGVGTARFGPAAASYGTDKAIFGYGNTTLSDTGAVSVINKVSNTGVAASDTTGVGTARNYLAAAGYGADKAIFGYGRGVNSIIVSMINLVSNTGVVASDTTGVGTARYQLGAAGFSTAGPAPSGLKFKKVFADPVTSIVTSGLVLNLDASNASSYAGSGTSWFDLSGNGNNGTLTNGPTFNSANGGSIVFDGTNDYISIGSQNIVGTGTSAFTGELWWYINKTLASGEYIMPIRIKQDSEFFIALYNPSGTYNLYGTFRGYAQYGIPVTNSDYINKWICMQFVYTGGNKNTASSYKFYINGAQIAVGSNSFGAAGGEGANCNIIGADGNSGCNTFFTSGVMKGNIASYRLYTGELTAAQLLQNYNATKTKFGL